LRIIEWREKKGHFVEWSITFISNRWPVC
jgi:hypothetical protein